MRLTQSVGVSFTCLALGSIACGAPPGEETATSHQAVTLDLDAGTCPAAWHGGAFVTTETWDCPTVEVLTSLGLPFATLYGEAGWGWLAEKGSSAAEIEANNPDITPAMIAGTQPWCHYRRRMVQKPTEDDLAREDSLMASQLAQIPGAETVAPVCWLPDRGNSKPSIPPCPTCICAESSSCIHETM
jgi:hypothetical protein